MTMNNQQFTIKYQPTDFNKMLPTSDVKSAIPTMFRTGKMPKAIGLFGTKGLGKSTAAKLIYKLLSCKNPDKAPCMYCDSCTSNDNDHLYMINAAASGGKDDVIGFCEEIQANSNSPIKNCYVYVFDESHALTTGAQNALLMTLDRLEENPESMLYIIFCTDQPDKLLGTLLNRLTVFNFHPLKSTDAINMIKDIAKHEGIDVTHESATEIAKTCDYTPRSILKYMQVLVTTGKAPSTIAFNDEIESNNSLKTIATVLINIVLKDSASMKTISYVKPLLKNALESGPESVRLTLYRYIVNNIMNLGEAKLTKQVLEDYLDMLSALKEPCPWAAISEQEMYIRILGLILKKVK